MKKTSCVMKNIIELTKPITINDFRHCDKVLVFNDLIGKTVEREDYVKTYVYDKYTDSAYLKRDLLKMNSNGKGNACNFSNTKVSLRDVVDSINWHVENGEKVEVYFDDMI